MAIFINRYDHMEIGAMSTGQGYEARKLYVDSIAKVLINCKTILLDEYEVFLVANDKYNLYPRIAEQAGMRIVKQFTRPVLDRAERDKGAYSETIFHMRSENGSCTA